MIEECSGELLDELVLQARAGSGAACTAIWESLGPAVAGYVRGRGVVEVARVTSDAFLAAFSDADSIAGTGQDFRCRLFTLASRQAAAELRLDTAPTSSSAGGEQLEQLPDDQRNVLLLRVVAELSVEQVAVVIGRSPDAVRQLQHRALARLRRQLAATAAKRPACDGGSPLVIKAASW